MTEEFELTAVLRCPACDSAEPLKWIKNRGECARGHGMTIKEGIVRYAARNELERNSTFEEPSPAAPYHMRGWRQATSSAHSQSRSPWMR